MPPEDSGPVWDRAVHDRLEYLHGEARALRENVIRLSERVDHHDTSLKAGADRFAQLDNLIRPKPLEWWKVLLAIVAVASPVGAIGVTIARAPTRDEVQEIREEIQKVREQQAGANVLLETLLRRAPSP